LKELVEKSRNQSLEGEKRKISLDSEEQEAQTAKKVKLD